MQTAYAIQSLTKIYTRTKTTANQEIDLAVQAGELFAILGPNGSGKSTLVRQMVGHLRPTAGQIHLLGRDVVKEPDTVPNIVAYLPQAPFALSNLTILEALECTGLLRGLSAPAVRREAMDLVELLGLGKQARRTLQSLSGGQKRLVGFATALIGHLPVLVLDEPTNELDPLNRRLIWNLLHERNAQEGTTVIVVTHNVLEVEQVVDRVALFDHGKLIALDTVGALKRRVDARMRIEMTVSPSRMAAAHGYLTRFGPVYTVTETRLRLFVEKEAIGHVVSSVVEQLESIGCEEYRLVPPSLEDVYFHFGGKEASLDASAS